MIASERLEQAAAEFYDADLAAIYVQVWDPPLACQQDAVCVELAGPLEGARVLDAAAGTGALAEALLARGADATCNELSAAMRARARARTATRAGQSIRVVDPGRPWRALASGVGAARFDLVVCLGAALSHCSLAGPDMLADALAGFASVLVPRGRIIVDCKHYSATGLELDRAGVEKRRHVDRLGDGTELRHSFSALEDRTLVRTMEHHTDASSAEPRRRWQCRLWPVDAAEIRSRAARAGLREVRAVPMGDAIGATETARYDYLAFQIA